MYCKDCNYFEIVQEPLPDHYDAGIAVCKLYNLETLDVDVANIPTIQAVPIEVLDKIRADIDSHCSDNRDRNDGLYIAMKIIDKYRKEQE